MYEIKRFSFSGRFYIPTCKLTPKSYQLAIYAIGYKIDIQGGRGSAPFKETAYRVKYFKPIPKEINQDASTVWT